MYAIIFVMRNIFKKHSNFAAHRESDFVKTKFFIAKAGKTLFPNDARYGFIVTKKSMKRAVQRNRAKRLLRVWLRLNEEFLLPELDYIFIARREILDASFTDAVNQMKDAIEKLNKNA